MNENDIRNWNNYGEKFLQEQPPVIDERFYGCKYEKIPDWLRKQFVDWLDRRVHKYNSAG